ncbi:MAG: hypothetical protein ACRCW4_14170 [Candidatus Neomicrothrix subdominans]
MTTIPPIPKQPTTIGTLAVSVGRGLVGWDGQLMSQQAWDCDMKYLCHDDVVQVRGVRCTPAIACNDLTPCPTHEACVTPFDVETAAGCLVKFTEGDAAQYERQVAEALTIEASSMVARVMWTGEFGKDAPTGAPVLNPCGSLTSLAADAAPGVTYTDPRRAVAALKHAWRGTGRFDRPTIHMPEIALDALFESNLAQVTAAGVVTMAGALVIADPGYPYDPANPNPIYLTGPVQWDMTPPRIEDGKEQPSPCGYEIHKIGRSRAVVRFGCRVFKAMVNL